MITWTVKARIVVWKVSWDCYEWKSFLLSVYIILLYYSLLKFITFPPKFPTTISHLYLIWMQSPTLLSSFRSFISSRWNSLHVEVQLDELCTTIQEAWKGNDAVGGAFISTKPENGSGVYAITLQRMKYAQEISCCHSLEAKICK